jgi:hemerythrin-like domain-containing protein
MNSTALKIIQDEHQALAAMLHSLVMMAKRSTEETTAGDFEVIRAMLFYITEFPEKLHHTKESESLFPLVAARSPEVRQVIKELDEQHDQGEKAVSHLMSLLIAWEMMGESRRPRFLQAIEKYRDFYMDHMRTEMNVVIPVAQAVLSHDDWTLLDSVFEANQDPMIGHQPTKEFERLFKQILSNAPEPIGLGRVVPA